MQHLKTSALKNNGKFADHNLEKLCRRSLASDSSIPVLGLERVCPRKVGPWPRIFFRVLGLGLEGCVLNSTSEMLILRCSTSPVVSFFPTLFSLRLRSLSHSAL